jgi:hypothetical protein
MLTEVLCAFLFSKVTVVSKKEGFKLCLVDKNLVDVTIGDCILAMPQTKMTRVTTNSAFERVLLRLILVVWLGADVCVSW